MKTPYTQWRGNQEQGAKWTVSRVCSARAQLYVEIRLVEGGGGGRGPKPRNVLREKQVICHIQAVNFVQ